MNRERFVTELSKLRPTSTFLSLMRYRNAYSEVADYSIVFHMSYENALKKSIAALEAHEPISNLQKLAKEELLRSYQSSLKRMDVTPIEDIRDGYSRFFDEDGNYIKGVKLHKRSDTLHLYGLLNSKRVIMPGLYPPDDRSEFAAVKDHLAKIGPVSRFRQFKVRPDQVDKITVEKLTLLPQS
jgi:hypothetical protein